MESHHTSSSVNSVDHFQRNIEAVCEHPSLPISGSARTIEEMTRQFVTKTVRIRTLQILQGIRTL